MITKCALSAALATAADSAHLVINAVIYAEVSVRFTRIEDLEDALPKSLFQREPIPFEAAFLAGKAFLAYQNRGGLKRSPLPDFIIGAHALLQCQGLITRDAGFFRDYFKGLKVIVPKAS